MTRRKSSRERIRQLRIAADDCDAIANELLRMDRGPFRDVLVELLGCPPEPEALKQFADKSPDRWAQAIQMMAALAGFEKGVVVNIGALNVTQMTDAQLLAEMTKHQGEVARLLTPPTQAESPSRAVASASPVTIDAEVVENSPGSGEGNSVPSSPGVE